MHLSPPKKKHTRNKNKKRLCLSIHPSIHLSIHQSIGGPITPFISYPYIYWILSQNGMGPMTKTSDVAPKKRWCESFNLAYHLGKPPWCWSGCYFGTDGRWSFFFWKKLGNGWGLTKPAFFWSVGFCCLMGMVAFLGKQHPPQKRTKPSILGVQDVYFPGCWAFGAECWMVFGILYLQKLLMG